MSSATETQHGHGFGVAPVFLAAICTILGAVMFLRFGYAVGNVGLLGAVGIIVLGHLVTIPTAMAIAEIATNRRVEGGGEYFIISRSFGRAIGSVIGLPLFCSQGISVAFYMIAFAEAFRPLAEHFERFFGAPFDPRMVSLPAVVLLVLLMLFRGADIGVKALWVVAVTLALSLILFFLGSPLPTYDPGALQLFGPESGDGFFLVFAICFPAFTGMTAGVGLSGDLRNPRRSIPLGTMTATITGLVVYLALVTKLAFSAPPDMLAGDQHVMMHIAVWGPMILIGLACATISSAIGSILVAPRTLQALAGDQCFPSKGLNKWLAWGKGKENEPRNATLVTGVIAISIVAMGELDFVARIISMFFMVTYGSLCAISFLEHFAARPSYRPSFRSKWSISLFGAVICLLMMFQMDPFFAILALLVLALLYNVVRRSQNNEQNDLGAMFQGVMTQATRYMQLKLQKTRRKSEIVAWRPSVIMVNDRSFDRRSPLDMMNWICARYGFGTYLHFVQGRLDAEALAQSQSVHQRLLELGERYNSSVYLDTIISPSMRSALAQSLQLPGVFGMTNNTVMFEFSSHDPDKVLQDLVDNSLFAAASGMDQLILRHSDLYYGARKNIHIWLTANDEQNANLMILIAFIILGHRDWKGAEIAVFAAVPTEDVDERKASFTQLISQGRIPIAEKNVRFMPVDGIEAFIALVSHHSQEADLVILGSSPHSLKSKGIELLRKHPSLHDVLFVLATDLIVIE